MDLHHQEVGSGHEHGVAMCSRFAVQEVGGSGARQPCSSPTDVKQLSLMKTIFNYRITVAFDRFLYRSQIFDISMLTAPTIVLVLSWVLSAHVP